MSSWKQPAIRAPLFLGLVAALVAGCHRDGIQVYRVAKEAPAPAGAALPPGWEPGPASQMRAASFRVKGQGGKIADVSVVPLPGMAGSDLANVNRWREQVGLGPVTENELSNFVQTVEVAGSSGQLYDFTGENTAAGDKTRMLAAILRRDNVAWFFKMTGDDILVGEQKPAFLSYLKTFQFPGMSSESASADTPQELPPNHPPIGGSGPLPLASTDSAGLTTPAAASGPGEGKPTWKVPAAWRETTAGQFLVAKFLIAAANNSQAAVNVSSSGGDGGGLVMNVNRWRKQLGLPDVDAAAAEKLATPLDAGAAKAMLIDMTGSDPRTGDKSRLIAVIVPQPSQTWFYKLMGPLPVVEQEKENFIRFVQTVQYAQ